MNTALYILSNRTEKFPSHVIKKFQVIVLKDQTGKRLSQMKLTMIKNWYFKNRNISGDGRNLF